MTQKFKILALLLILSGCSPTPRSGTPAEFPFPVSLPGSVSTKGVVKHESTAQYEFRLGSSKEIALGEKWSGHVQVNGFANHDPAFLATLERSLVRKTGWKSVYRDETRDPPIATLHRSLGGEHLWITLEGWPEDVTVTMVHRK
jgi:hypothetical protein